MSFITLLISVSSAYVLAALGGLIALTIGWRRRHGRGPDADVGSGTRRAEFISVLVAARDEEEMLPQCLSALQQQDYPADRIEFLIADDHSSDATPQIIARLAERDPRVHLIRVPDPSGVLRGKAHALHHAFQVSRGTILLTTDADCAPPPGWARAMAAQFDEPRTGMVCGVTTVEHETPLDRIQALDWLLLLSVASAASSAGFPLTAMGNNMAFRREAFEAVGGFPALPFSVTEDYALFQAIRRTGTWRVRLSLDRALRNHTKPLTSFRDIFNQRKRWARGGLRASATVYALYLTVFLTHLLLLVGLAIAPTWAASLLIAKCLADLSIVATASRRLGERGLLRTFPLFEAYLFAYVTAMPFALLVAPGTRWKERTFA